MHGNQNLTLTDLLTLDNSVTTHDRNLQKVAAEMYIAKNNLSPLFMKHIFTEPKNPYNLRNNRYFYADSIRTILYGSESISLRSPKTWVLVLDEIKNSKRFLDFKHKIKRWRPQRWRPHE